MKTNRDYSAQIQQCALLLLTNAAFLLNLSLKANEKSLSRLLLKMSESFEQNAQKLIEILPEKDDVPLSPAFCKKLSDDWTENLLSAKSDAVRVHRILLLLSAYAPDARSRRKIMKICLQTRWNIDILASLS